MLVATKPRSESSFELQHDIAKRVAFLQTGDWVHTPLAGAIPAESMTNSTDNTIEDRVMASAAGLIVEGACLLSPSITRYHVEQDFEGVVLSVDQQERQFYARLVDETDNNSPDEEVLMSFDEISADDLDLIIPGALFSWVMGRTERNGLIERHSEIRFRRMFKFSKQAIQKAEAAASELYSLL